MQEFDLEDFVYVGQMYRFARERYWDGNDGKMNGSVPLSDKDKEHIKTAFEIMTSCCEDIGADEVSEFLRGYIEAAPKTLDVFDAVADAFWKAIATKTVFYLGKHKAKYLEDIAPFGDLVRAVFPEAGPDIESASRALAFDMPVAAVFHLMRAMEIAVAAIAKQIGVANTDVDWGQILGSIDLKIKDMPKDADRKKWSEARAHLWHVKECWRNETMHPRRTYTQEQAEEIFRAVKTFMVHLAALIPNRTVKVTLPGKS